jgi:hypothetical protein
MQRTRDDELITDEQAAIEIAQFLVQCLCDDNNMCVEDFVIHPPNQHYMHELAAICLSDINELWKLSEEALGDIGVGTDEHSFSEDEDLQWQRVKKDRKHLSCYDDLNLKLNEIFDESDTPYATKKYTH